MWCRWLLVHALLIEAEGFLRSASSSLFARWFCFQRLLLLSAFVFPQHHLINAIFEEERWARPPADAHEGHSERLGTGQRPVPAFYFL
jgi:hypothetical protein